MALETSLLGVMELDQFSVDYRSLPDLAKTWLQDAGGFAAVGLLVWMFYALLTPSPAIAGGRRKLISKFMAIVGVLALIAYLVALGFTIASRIDANRTVEELALTPEQKVQFDKFRKLETKLDFIQGISLAAAGFLAIVAFCEPFVLDLLRLRFRRVYALAKLSFKEAIRRRIVWVFFIFLLIFLFPVTWFHSRGTKPEDMLKATISVISLTMTVLLIFTALLLSAFSIPNDVKNQTIHTIVTKPVERFEVVLGRFLGYLSLMSIALVLLTAVSLLFISTSGIDPKSKVESMMARVPVYGTQSFTKERFENNKFESKPFEGIDVGNEYGYRHYITGSPRSFERAVWSFNRESDLKHLAEMPAIPMEFAFDIYRTTKGVENQGVLSSFDLVTLNWDQSRTEEYQKEIRATFNGSYPKSIQPENPASPSEQIRADWEKMNAIAEKFGRWEYRNYSVHDYHTYRLYIPPGLLKNALRGKPTKDTPLQSFEIRGRQVETVPSHMQVKLKCESPGQMLGVAALDLYFLESEGSFYFNFFKGALGLWCRLAIVIGVAVAASTYLAGVVSFLAAAVLFLAGYFLDFIRSLTIGDNLGGGPFESFTRLVKGTTGVGELDKTPTVSVALFTDDVFRWLLRRIINIIPDTERFTWSNYLSQGFNIGSEFIAINLLILIAYTMPWAVLAYYLMRSREIAA